MPAVVLVCVIVRVIIALVRTSAVRARAIVGALVADPLPQEVTFQDKVRMGLQNPLYSPQRNRLGRISALVAHLLLREGLEMRLGHLLEVRMNILEDGIVSGVLACRYRNTGPRTAV